jgi:hypothetical protein
LARLFAVLVQVLALAISMQLSGVGHVVTDLVLAAQGVAHDEGDCPVEKNGHECPPGCPDCHCTHGGMPSLPPTLDVLACVLAIHEVLAWSRASDTVPSPDRASIFRPPRLTPRLA